MKTTATEIAPEWHEHPLVKEGLSRVGDDYSALDLLTAVHDTMTELEDRFPGLSFDQILNGSRGTSRATLAGVTKACGASDTDIGLIFGESSKHAGEQDTIGPAEFELAGRGVSPSELVNMGYSQAIANEISRIRLPLTEQHRRAIEYMNANDTDNITETAKAIGANRNTVRLALRKRRFEAWKAMRQ